jgi:hypothetical protein
LAGCTKRSAGGPDLAQLPTGSPAIAFEIKLGVTDTDPTGWDGSIEVSAGRLVSLAGWRFYKDDQVLPGGKSWKCATRRLPVIPPKLWWLGAKHEVPPDVNAPPPPGPMLPNGILAVIDAPPGSEIRITTPNGNFAFSPESAAWQARRVSLRPRRGRARHRPVEAYRRRRV